MLVNQSGMALVLYDDALTANPGDPVLLKKKAEALIHSGQTGKAEQIYQQLFSANPNDPEVLVRMGDFSVPGTEITRGDLVLRYRALDPAKERTDPAAGRGCLPDARRHAIP